MPSLGGRRLPPFLSSRIGNAPQTSKTSNSLSSRRILSPSDGLGYAFFFSKRVGAEVG